MLAERAAGLVVLCECEECGWEQEWRLGAERGVKPGIGANGRDCGARRNLGKA
jgi:hypothetical protein